MQKSKKFKNVNMGLFITIISMIQCHSALIVATLPILAIMLLSVFNGLAMYAYFEGCDPIISGIASKPDEVMPLIIITIFQEYPGLAGLFVSAAYSGTLR